ncbi:MurR/RpiR family transcriptional regulator [Oceanobacillus manasiensis]|uniref:MurR/RpiR family transcriptional regulator n=1 Tax=Oceanobacillus manasiensis TaxID=586413 RepID=UPI0005A74B6A|nr:MurR/RpiR family transcriptional regulator [Oceanobacillus manasiensis]
MSNIDTFNARVYQFSDKLTSSDEIIARYIVNHPQEVSRMKITELAHKLYISKSSLARFCTKLGYDGFIELKNSLRSELVEDEEETIKISNLLDDLTHDYRVLLNRYTKYSAMDEFEKLANIIMQKDHIYLFGLGHSALSSQLFATQLKRLGIRAEATDSVEEMKMLLGNLNQDDLLILNTHSSKNFNIINILSIAKEFKIDTFLITSFGNPNIIKLVNNYIVLPNTLHLKLSSLINPSFITNVMIDIVIGCLIDANKDYMNKYQRSIRYINED